MFNNQLAFDHTSLTTKNGEKQRQIDSSIALFTIFNNISSTFIMYDDRWPTKVETCFADDQQN